MDQSDFHLINERWTSPALDLFMAAISNVEIWKPVLIALVVYALVFMGFKGTCVHACLLFAADVSRIFFGRPAEECGRPFPAEAGPNRAHGAVGTNAAEFLALFHRTTIRYSDQTDRGKSGPRFRPGT